jgi:rhodanese-related sulfurtransferase
MSFLSKLFGGGESLFENIDINTYEEQYFKQKNHTLIDVRTKGEFSQAHISGAKNYPLATLAKNTNRIPKDKPIIVVCQTGSRSRTGAKMLAQAGFENVINLKGGTMRWMMAGKQVKK